MKKIPMAEAGDEGVEECFDDKQVVVGICAMAKKSESKPMREILNRMDEFEYIKTIVFAEETVLKVNSSNESLHLNACYIKIIVYKHGSEFRRNAA